MRKEVTTEYLKNIDEKEILVKEFIKKDIRNERI